MDGKGSCRLHPSLPQTDRWEAGVPQGARGLHGRSTDAQVGTYASVEDTIADGQETSAGVRVTGNIS